MDCGKFSLREESIVSMESLALFGAGKIGKQVLNYFKAQGKDVCFFIDNNSDKWGTNIDGVPVIGIEEFVSREEEYHVYVACGANNHIAIMNQLHEAGLNNCYIFDAAKLWKYNKRETIVSYSHIDDMEDVILYNVFHNIKDVFYIDIGANDPWVSSVTKLIYDHGGTGIDIEPIPELAELYPIERPRDIVVCAGIGKENSQMTLYLQGMTTGEGSTLKDDGVDAYNKQSITIDVYPLRDICKKYIGNNQPIHFLKVDVEGAEKEVLLGADFDSYRPWCIVMESTLPNTNIPCYEEWEGLLLNKSYHFVFSHGVNRYYVADEHKELDDKFISVEALLQKYRVFHAEQVR